MFENITFESIMKNMLKKIDDNLDKREGSIIYNAIAPAAVELQNIYIELDWILNQSFVDTSSREYLIRRCKERGIEAKKATKAILEGNFNIDVDIGSRFSLDNLTYKVVNKMKNGNFQLECEVEGEVGNEKLGDIIPIDYIDGLTYAKLISVLIPGENEEETENLRKKYLSSFEVNAYGGNIKDYIDKTNSISGVGATRVTPVWKGGGTVLVTILDYNFNKASKTLIDKVQDILDPEINSGKGYGVAPIGHKVTVTTVEELKIDITSKISLDLGVKWMDVKYDIVKLIQNYLKELKDIWSESNIIVRVSQIDTRILSVKGVIDVSCTGINGKNENLILGMYEIPIMGEVTKL